MIDRVGSGTKIAHRMTSLQREPLKRVAITLTIFSLVAGVFFRLFRLDW